MKLYIKNINTFATLKALTVTAYEISLDNTNDSSIAVYGTHDSNVGDLALCSIGADLFCGVITAMIPKDGATTIKAAPLLSLFDKLVYGGTAFGTLTQRLNTTVINNFKSQSDELYRYSWLTPSMDTAQAITSGADPTLDDADYYNFHDYLVQLTDRFPWFRVGFTVTDTGATVSTQHSFPTATVDMGLSSNILTSEVFSNKLTAKITNHITADGTLVHYYLAADGTFSPYPPNPRITGAWIHMIDKTEQDIAAAFGKNTFAHSIKFYSKQRLHDHQSVKIRFEDGRVVQSIITSVMASSKTGLYAIGAGTLVTTLSEQLKGVLKQ